MATAQEHYDAANELLGHVIGGHGPESGLNDSTAVRALINAVLALAVTISNASCGEPVPLDTTSAVGNTATGGERR